MFSLNDRVVRRYGKLTHVYGTVVTVMSTKCCVLWDNRKKTWHVGKTLKRLELAR